jgi:hypothetical protein
VRLLTDWAPAGIASLRTTVMPAILLVHVVSTTLELRTSAFESLMLSKTLAEMYLLTRKATSRSTQSHRFIDHITSHHQAIGLATSYGK